MFSTNAYIMLYELESAPFAQKPSTLTTNKLKTLPGNGSCSSNKEQTFVNTKSNGITSDKKVYGPELPATMNGTNGKNDSSSSSSESETETVNVKSGSCSERLLPAPSMPSVSEIPEKSPMREERKSRSPPILKPQNRIIALPSPSVSSIKNSKDSSAPVTKLVPYEMDDSSNCSDESSCSRAEAETRIAPKATIGIKTAVFIVSCDLKVHFVI